MSVARKISPAGVVPAVPVVLRLQRLRWGGLGSSTIAGRETFIDPAMHLRGGKHRLLASELRWPRKAVLVLLAM